MSGQIRTLNECYDTLIVNLVETNPEYNFDIIAVLDTKKKDEEFDLTRYNFKKYIKSVDSKLPNLDYQLEKLAFDHYTFPNNYYQLIGLRDVNKLRLEVEKEVGINYDILIRTRADFKFYTPLYLNGINFDNEIFIPYGNDYRGGYNDRFAIGNRDLMNQYMNRFNFWMNKQDHIEGYSTHAELNLKQFLDERKININRIPFSYCLRRNGFDFNEYHL